MTTMNSNEREKDAKTISELFKEWHYADNLGVLRGKLVEYVVTVRQEARAAAFKEMLSAVAVLPTQGTMNYRRGYEEGLRDALRTLEAAANSVKDSEGEGVADDGRV